MKLRYCFFSLLVCISLMSACAKNDYDCQSPLDYHALVGDTRVIAIGHFGDIEVTYRLVEPQLEMVYFEFRVTQYLKGEGPSEILVAMPYKFYDPETNIGTFHEEYFAPQKDEDVVIFTTDFPHPYHSIKVGLNRSFSLQDGMLYVQSHRNEVLNAFKPIPLQELINIIEGSD